MTSIAGPYPLRPNDPTLRHIPILPPSPLVHSTSGRALLPGFTVRPYAVLAPELTYLTVNLPSIGQFGGILVRGFLETLPNYHQHANLAQFRSHLAVPASGCRSDCQIPPLELGLCP